MKFSAELRKVDVDVVTFGQYMRPTKRHMKVDRYVEPAEFDHWRQVAENMGFLYVASGPLVRSSYKVCDVHSRMRCALLTLTLGWRVFHRERPEGQGRTEANPELDREGESSGRRGSFQFIVADTVILRFLLVVLCSPYHRACADVIHLRRFADTRRHSPPLNEH